MSKNRELADLAGKDLATQAELDAAVASSTEINDGTVSATDTWSSQKIDTDKQDTLVSGTNIKTIGGASILGSGDMVVGGGATDYQEFTTSGTWTKPDGINYVYVEVLGAGGSGAKNTSTDMACGGAGGEFVSKIIKASDVSSSEIITIGAGGIATVGTGNGTNGGNSSFGGLITAYGGYGGSYTSNTTMGCTRPNSGSATSYVFYNPFVGFSGNDFIPGYATIYGGGGGGGVGTSKLNGGTSSFAGNGGNGWNSSTTQILQNGTYPAGGGGGANGTATQSGAGANGRVRVWCW